MSKVKNPFMKMHSDDRQNPQERPLANVNFIKKVSILT